MKAIHNNTESFKNFGIEKIRIENHEFVKDNDVKIIDFYEDADKAQMVISLYSRLFSDNRQKIYISENKLVIIVSELVRTISPDTVYISDWLSYSQQSYTRFRNISMFLPGDNFYLLRHYFIPESYILNIIIGKLLNN